MFGPRLAVTFPLSDHSGYVQRNTGVALVVQLSDAFSFCLPQLFSDKQSDSENGMRF